MVCFDPWWPGSNYAVACENGTLGAFGTLFLERDNATSEETYMKRLLLIGFAACACALAPTLSASAMPAATPNALVSADATVIQVKGGHGHGRGHMRRGGRGHHYGWSRGRHRGWR